MREIADWLIYIEQMAGTFYSRAAEKPGVSKRLSTLFLHLAGEEAMHFHIMKSAYDCLSGEGREERLHVTLDSETKEKIENALRENTNRLSSDDFGEGEMLECMMETEFSEWNDIFLYVVNTLKGECREFMYAASRIQKHMRQIEKFMETFPEGQRHLGKIRDLPSIWKERILIVDDFEPVSEFLKSIFQRIAFVETAGNGEEGFRKIQEKYFDCIISDIQMPVMDGIELFRNASTIDDSIGERFLFLTSALSPEVIAFFQNNELRYMEKPATIAEIKRSVLSILDKPLVIP